MQRGPSARLKQISQSVIFSLTSRIACGERERVLAGRAQHVEREALRRAVADPRQLGQLGDEPLEGRGEHATSACRRGARRGWARRREAAAAAAAAAAAEAAHAAEAERLERAHRVEAARPAPPSWLC